MAGWAEAALFAASRAEHAAEVIRPALERGADVVCDRFVDSSLAYQGIARGLGLDAVLQLNLTVLEGLLPDRTFVLALDAGAAGARRRGDPDRIEREGDDLPGPRRRRLRGARAAGSPARIELLDGSLPAEEIAAHDSRPCAGVALMFEALIEQERGEAPARRGAARGAGARLSLPRAGGRRQAAGGDRVRRRAARRRRPRLAAGASRPVRAGAARRPDPDRRRPRAAPRPAHAPVRGATDACT